MKNNDVVLMCLRQTCQKWKPVEALLGNWSIWGADNVARAVVETAFMRHHFFQIIFQFYVTR